MSEVQEKKQVVFNFTNRKIQLNKSDFTSEAEKQIYEFFQQNTKYKETITQNDFYNRFKFLDFGDNSDKVITEKEISEFLKLAQSQGTLNLSDSKFKTKMLKNVTEEDLIRFFNKIIDLNPTEIEIRKNKLQSGLKDEQGNAVFNDEILDNFKKKDDTIKLSDIIDENNNVKAGYEIFDLNDDGKIDDLEKKELGSYFDLATLSDITKKFVNAGVKNGVLTAENKHSYYKMLEDAHNAELVSTIENSSLKDPKTNKNLVTPEVKHLFSTDRKEISIDDLVDENGNIKKGLELFDLNNDGKIDELERNYFTNGGKFVNKGSNTITLEDFVKILSDMDKFDTRIDSVLSNNDKETLYLYIQGAYQMLDTLKEFPDDVRNLYEQALYSLSRLEICQNKSFSGFQREDLIAIKDTNASENGKPNKFNVASVLFHELTHFICNNLSDGKSYNYMAQEVQTFYMEHKLSEKMKNIPNFRYLDMEKSPAYTYLKENNPELTELDIAKAVFTAEHFDWYNSYFGNKDTNILNNSEYRAIGDYFNEPDNKAQIYNAGIQKAFSGLSLKDENGKELITDEIKNTFSAEKPIITIKDILDSDGKVKAGFEIFDFDGDGILSSNERSYIGLVSYNDIPRLVETLKRFNLDVNKNNGDVISTQVRRQFEEKVLHVVDMTRMYNYHCIKK